MEHVLNSPSCCQGRFSSYRPCSTHTSALHSWNQIKFQACSRLVLYLENVLGARHKHVTVRKPPPFHNSHLHFIFYFLFASTQGAASYRGPCLSVHLFSSDAEPSRKTVWYGTDAWLISPPAGTWLCREHGGVAFREDKPGWRLGEMKWVAPSATVTTAPVIYSTVRWWSEEVAGCDWDISVWHVNGFDQQYDSHSSKNSRHRLFGWKDIPFTKYRSLLITSLKTD